MRGKIGLIVGFAVGYVFGTRAGRARYEQIKQGAAKVWELDIVQDRVDDLKALGKRTLLFIPKGLFNLSATVARGVQKETQIVSAVAVDLADAAAEVTEGLAQEREKLGEEAAAENEAAPEPKKPAAKPAPRKTTAAKKPAAKKPAARKPAAKSE